MELLTPGLGLFIWTLVAFLAVFFILKKYAWQPILKALDTREKNIADSIAAADRMKKDMATMQNENERILQEARESRAAIIAEAKEAKDKIINEAKEQAKADAAKIVRDAQLQIENQKLAAMTEIKNQIGNLSVEVAEKVLRKQLSNDAEQAHYAKQLAEDVSLN